MIRFARLSALLFFALAAMGCMAGRGPEGARGQRLGRRVVAVHAATLPQLPPSPPPGQSPEPPADTVPAPVADGYAVSAVAVTSRSGSKIASCLGVMVAPRVALTAGHCVVGRTETRVRRATAPARSADDIAVTSIWYDPNSDTSNGNVDTDNSDVAILVLERPLAMPAYATYARVPLRRPVQAFAARHTHVLSARRLEPMGITLRRSARAKYYVSEGFAAPGDSGSPVFVRTDEGDLVVVAVLAGGSPGRELLARVDVLSDKLDELVVSTASPAPRRPGPTNTPTTAASTKRTQTVTWR